MCFRLDSLGIKGLYVESQSKGLVIVPIAGVCPNAVSEYQTIVDDGNNALQK